MRGQFEQLKDGQIAEYLRIASAPVGIDEYFRSCKLHGVALETARQRHFVERVMMHYHREEVTDEGIAEALRKSGISMTVEEYFAEQNRRKENANEARRRMNVVKFIREKRRAQQETVISNGKTILRGKR